MPNIVCNGSSENDADRSITFSTSVRILEAFADPPNTANPRGNNPALLPGNTISRYLGCFFLRDCSWFRVLSLEKERTKLGKSFHYVIFATNLFYICHSENPFRTMVFWYYARLQISRYKRDLPFQYSVTVVQRNHFVSHTLRQSFLVEQCLLPCSISQHGGFLS